MDDGGSAFPYQKDVVLFSENDPTRPAQTIRGVWTGGMTLRDYFAAKALAPLIAAIVAPQAQMDSDITVAKIAYKLADAMLKAREAK